MSLFKDAWESTKETARSADPTNPNTGIGGIIDDPIGTVERVINDPMGELAQAYTDIFVDPEPWMIGLFPGLGVSKLIHDYLTPEIPDLDAEIRGVEVNKVGANNYLPIVYGQSKIGGTIVYIGVSGLENEYFHVVYAMCEGEISGYDSHYIDDVISTDPKFTGHVDITEYVGTPTQFADPLLVAAFPGWTANHQLKGVAYVSVRYKWRQGVFSSLPRLTSVVNGKLVYDPRSSTTYWSANNALCAYDYATNNIYGKGLSSLDFDMDALFASANECDLMVTPYGSEPLEQQFEMHGVVDTSRPVIDNMKTMTASFRAGMSSSGGKYKISVDRDDAAIFDLDQSKIIGGFSFSGGDKRGKKNRVSTTFRNPEKNWKADIAIKESSVFFANDDAVVLDANVNLPLNTRYWRAADNSFYILKKSRQQISFSCVATIEALSVETGDVINVTHPSAGWVNKKFRVSADMMYNGNIAISGIEHESSVYSRDSHSADIVPGNTNLPDPYTVSPPVISAPESGTNHLVPVTGGYLSSAYISWLEPADIYIERYFVEWKKSTDVNFFASSPTEGKENLFHRIVGLTDGVNYDFRVRSQNSNGIYSSWSSYNNYTIIGKSENPNEPTSVTLTPAEGGFLLSWTNPADLDIDNLLLYRHTAATPIPNTHVYPISAGPPSTTQTFFIKEPNGSDLYFWVRLQDSSELLSNIVSTTPAHAVSGDLKYADGTDISTLKPNEPGATSGADWAQNLTDRPKIFRIAARGNTSVGYPISSGLSDESGVVLKSGARSYNLSVFDRSSETWDSHTTYDVYGSGANATTMANALNALGSTKIVVIFSNDEPNSNRTTGGLPDALLRCGASENMLSRILFRSAYILVGVAGCGRGNGLEYYAGEIASDPNAWLDVAIQIYKGNIQTSGNAPDTDKTKTAIEAGLDVTSGGIENTGKGGFILGTSGTQPELYLSNNVYGQAGLQAQYNSNNFRFYMGNGDNNFWKFLNGKVSSGPDVELQGTDCIAGESVYYHTFFESVDFIKHTYGKGEYNPFLDFTQAVPSFSSWIASSHTHDWFSAYKPNSWTRRALTWAKPRRVIFNVKLGVSSPNSNIDVRLLHGAANKNLGGAHLGFLWRGTTLYSTSSDSINVRITNLNVTAVNNAEHTLEIRHIVSPSVKVEFYVDGVLKYTETSTTYIATSGSIANMWDYYHVTQTGTRNIGGIGFFITEIYVNQPG